MKVLIQNHKLKFLSNFYLFLDCCNGTTDVIFVLDASNSVGVTNFELVRRLVKNVSNGFPTDSSFQVGVVVYEELVFS